MTAYGIPQSASRDTRKFWGVAAGPHKYPVSPWEAQAGFNWSLNSLSLNQKSLQFGYMKVKGPKELKITKGLI